MANKFVNALKPKPEAPVPTPAARPLRAASEKPAATAPSRQGARHVGGYFDPVVAKQLRLIAAEEESSIQELLAEALDMLFQSRKKPMIAQKNVN